MEKRRLFLFVVLLIAITGLTPAVVQGERWGDGPWPGSTGWEPRAAWSWAPLTPSALAGGAIARPGNLLLELVGQLGGAVRGMTVHGNYVYIGVGPRLAILDISNPAAPRLIGETARCRP